MSKKSASTSRTPMTPSDASRIQSAQARVGNGQVIELWETFNVILLTPLIVGPLLPGSHRNRIGFGE